MSDQKAIQKQIEDCALRWSIEGVLSGSSIRYESLRDFQLRNALNAAHMKAETLFPWKVRCSSYELFCRFYEATGVDFSLAMEVTRDIARNGSITNLDLAS